MDPITLGVGAMAVGSLVQLFNSEKARGAEKSRLQDIQKMYDQIKPPDYDLKITDPPQLHTQALQSPQFAGEVNAPKYNLDKITPEQYKIVGQMNPQLAPYIAEKNPQVLQKSGDMQIGKDAQKAALQKFMQVGAGEADPEYQEAVTKAGRQAQGEAQSRQASILQDFARRGQGGSGISLAAQIGGTSQAMDRNAMANLDAASQAYRNRLNALSQGAQLGGQISQQDQNMQQQNANIINSFNQRMATNQQQYANQQAGTMNQAQMQNLQAAQEIANKNTGASNQENQRYQQRMDDIARTNASFQQSERNHLDQNAMNTYNAQVGERNTQNTLAQQQYQNSMNQQKYLNDLRGQKYSNDVARGQLKAGVSGQLGAQQMQSTQDRNQAIGGLTQAAGVYGMGQQQQQNQRNNAFQQADLASMQKTGSFMTPEQTEEYKKRNNYNDDSVFD